VLAALEAAGCALVPDADAAVGITFCAAFVAETGSLCLPAGPGLGNRASLLPELHLCLSLPRGVVPTLADLLGAGGSPLPSRLTLVTGPSRTGDIEGTMTAGVHGPGRVLHWILDGEDGEA
jgi:L-lactate utilization protein LutC